MLALRHTRLIIHTILFWALSLALALGDTLQESRWDQAKLVPYRRKAVENVVDRIERNIGRYRAVEAKTSVPAGVIAGLHNMEASGSFAKHLHEGSSLAGRTRWVPKGRPKTGKPPFAWEFSAIDALKYDGLEKVDWSYLDTALYTVERYNGVGYLKYHKDVPTPYIWSYTTLYKTGKYVEDGRWSQSAVSGQVGVGAIWKVMEERGYFRPSKLKRK